MKNVNGRTSVLIELNNLKYEQGISMKYVGGN